MGGVIHVRKALPGAVPADADENPPARQVEASPHRVASAALPMPARVLAWFDRHRFKLLIGVTLLYLLGFNGQWRIEPDSALYLTVGRNLARGDGYTYHLEPHRLAYPGLPYLFAATFRLFGEGSLLAHHVVMLGITFATLALVYRLFLLHAGRPTAVLMTVALAASRTFYRQGFELMTDMPFLMGVTAFLVGVESLSRRLRGKKLLDDDSGDPAEPASADARAVAFDPGPRGRPRWFDTLLLIGGLLVCVFTRPTMWALLLALALAAVWAVVRPPIRWRRVALGAGILAAVVIAAACFYAFDPRRAGPADRAPAAGAYEDAMLRSLATRADRVARRLVTDNLPKLLQPTAFEALLGVDIGALEVNDRTVFPLAVVPSLLVLGFALFLFRARPLWGLWVA